MVLKWILKKQDVRMWGPLSAPINTVEKTFAFPKERDIFGATVRFCRKSLLHGLCFIVMFIFNLMLPTLVYL
jgi:hypothetical protein